MLALPRSELPAISVAADPNGLALVRGVLHVADGETGAILRVGGSPLTTIDSGGVLASNRIGGLAAAPDGALYVTRLGYGSVGALFRVASDGTTTQVDLPPELWRLGVACDGDAIYTTQFHKAADGPYGGAVVRIADGRATTLADGLGKPVGVACVGDAVLATDAKQRRVVAIDAAGVRVLAAPAARPDSICACGRDSALVTTYDAVARRGAVVQLWLDGRTREIASGPWEPRGVATDGRRAYAAVRRGGRVLVFGL